MTKKVKKRSEHYEDKLALDASFEDIIKLSVMDNKPSMKILQDAKYYANLSEHTFVLNENGNRFPPLEFAIDTKDYNKIRIKVESENCIVFAIFNISGKEDKEPFNTNVLNQVDEQDIDIYESCLLHFELASKSKCMITFKLMKI